MVWTKLKGIAMALLAIGACIVGGTGVIAYQVLETRESHVPMAGKAASQTPVQLARAFPDEGPTALEPAPQAGPASKGGDEPRTDPPRVLEARLRLAQYRQEKQQSDFQAGLVGPMAVAEARFDVEILRAQLAAQREDLRDELELLQARQAVKEAELRRETALRSIGRGESQGEIKKAELNEVLIRIKQTERRLEVLDKIVKGLPALPAEPQPAAPRPAPAPAPAPEPAGAR